EPSQLQLAPPSLTGSIENVSGEFHLRLSNNDPVRVFQGIAQISFETTDQSKVTKVPVVIGPRESSIFLLYSLPATGQQYTLIVTDVQGRIVLHRIAPVRQITDISLANSNPTVTKPVKTMNAVTGNIHIKANLTGGEAEDDPFVLALEIFSPISIPNVTVLLTAKDFRQSARANLAGKTSVEFKLPDDLEAQKMTYTLSDAMGQVLTSGEADLNQLLSSEKISLSEISTDRENYKAGEMAVLKISLEGNLKKPYQLEIIGRDNRGIIFYRDSRRYSLTDKKGGTQEFTISLPKEASGTVKLEIKLSDAEQGAPLDTKEKEIILVEGTTSSG
ncbi:MAG TPA: hypothetical protein VEF04_02400, partial [Blastocatellia bacterium]|nr:hypothetical protein [Blastocatellia bacterium]